MIDGLKLGVVEPPEQVKPRWCPSSCPFWLSAALAPSAPMDRLKKAAVRATKIRGVLLLPLLLPNPRVDRYPGGHATR